MKTGKAEKRGLLDPDSWFASKVKRISNSGPSPHKQQLCQSPANSKGSHQAIQQSNLPNYQSIKAELSTRLAIKRRTGLESRRRYYAADNEDFYEGEENEDGLEEEEVIEEGEEVTEEGEEDTEEGEEVEEGHEAAELQQEHNARDCSTKGDAEEEGESENTGELDCDDEEAEESVEAEEDEEEIEQTSNVDCGIDGEGAEENDADEEEASSGNELDDVGCENDGSEHRQQEDVNNEHERRAVVSGDEEEEEEENGDEKIMDGLANRFLEFRESPAESKPKKRIIIEESDSEGSTAEDEAEDGWETQQGSEDEAEEGEKAEQSIECEAEVTEGPNKLKATDYFDDEASLSGDDVGSDDGEDASCDEANEYEAEEADDDHLPNEEEIRENLIKQYTKHQRDEDERHMMRVQEHFDAELGAINMDKSFRFRMRDDNDVDWSKVLASVENFVGGSLNEDEEDEKDCPVLAEGTVARMEIMKWREKAEKKTSSLAATADSTDFIEPEQRSALLEVGEKASFQAQSTVGSPRQETTIDVSSIVRRGSLLNSSSALSTIVNDSDPSTKSRSRGALFISNNKA